jgi:hypothetical protein
VTDLIDISDCAGVVIGKGGSTIRRIQQESGARLDIDKEEYGTFLKVTGMPEDVARAREAVERVRSPSVEQSPSSSVIREKKNLQDNNAHSKKDPCQNPTVQEDCAASGQAKTSASKKKDQKQGNTHISPSSSRAASGGTTPSAVVLETQGSSCIGNAPPEHEEQHASAVGETNSEAPIATALTPLGVLDVVEPLASGSSNNDGSLLGQVRALVGPADLLSPSEHSRTSLEKHHSQFAPNGEEWVSVCETYISESESSRQDRRDKLALLEQMASSSSTQGSGAEADLAMYLCGKIYEDCQRPDSVDTHKAARYWIGAAKRGVAFAMCGLGKMAQHGTLPGLPQGQPDFVLARGLWATAFAICDLPEAAHNLGVCFSFGHGGRIDYNVALKWYQACSDCDLDGTGRARDAPVGQPHGCLEALTALGPENYTQESFKPRASKGITMCLKGLAEELSRQKRDHKALAIVVGCLACGIPFDNNRPSRRQDYGLFQLDKHTLCEVFNFLSPGIILQQQKLPPRIFLQQQKEVKPETNWKVGFQVRVKGLVKAAQHNGKIGILNARAAPEGRVGVDLGGGQVLSIRKENLELVLTPLAGQATHPFDSKALPDEMGDTRTVDSLHQGPVAAGLKKCSGCLLNLPKNKFSKSQAKKDTRTRRCLDCSAAANGSGVGSGSGGCDGSDGSGGGGSGGSDAGGGNVRGGGGDVSSGGESGGNVSNGGRSGGRSGDEDPPALEADAAVTTVQQKAKLDLDQLPLLENWANGAIEIPDVENSGSPLLTAFNGQFSMNEKVGSRALVQSSSSGDAFYEARLNFLVIARQFESDGVMHHAVEDSEDDCGAPPPPPSSLPSFPRFFLPK